MMSIISAILTKWYQITKDYPVYRLIKNIIGVSKNTQTIHTEYFFCIVFTFVCMEYIYVSERKSAMLGIIRATKEGRSRIILSKWTVLVVMTVIFSLVQEIMVIVFDSFMYSTGNLKCSIQSLQIFRDCPYEISMFTAIIISILNHLLIAIIICSIVFVCFVSINSRIMECGIPIAIFLLEFLSLNDSPNNIFYAWNMKNVIGVYQNLNIAGTPVDKNYVNFIVGLAIIVFATLIGTILFSIRYVSEIKVVLQYIQEKIRNIFHGYYALKICMLMNFIS